jgi:hypothetical protein
MATKKRVSNQLGRLYRMGLLKRKRMKRPCFTKNGQICNRDFGYSYSLSKQGQAYLNYKKNTTVFTRVSGDMKRILSIASNPKSIPILAVASKALPLPRPIKDMLIPFVMSVNSAPSSIPLKGRYHRFAPRIDLWTMAKLANVGYKMEDKDIRIKRLEIEKKELKDRVHD